MEITKNESDALMKIFTDYLTDYNAFSIKGTLGMTGVGSMKLLKRMEEKGLLRSRKMGNATFYKANLENEYTVKLLELISLDHGHLSNYVKGWITDLRKNAIPKAVFIFGSILRKGKDANDIDVCFILSDSHDYKNMQKEVDIMNEKSRQKIHPLYLTEKDLYEKLGQKDAPVISMVKSCVIAKGEELF